MFKLLSRRLALTSLLLIMPALAACTFTPVHQSDSISKILVLQYAEPTSRLQQVIYQHLQTRLGKGADISDPLVTISVSTAGRRIGRTASGSVFTAYQMVATGTVIVTDSENKEKPLLSSSRTAAASYELSGQILADRAAEDEAKTRAVLALAETIRLSLISSLAGDAAK